MREFIYYSKNAVTTGNFDSNELMKAGRMDIACQIVIMAFHVSHAMRNDVKLHLILDGPPDAPKHLEMFPGYAEANNLGDVENKIDISKKDVAGLIKKMLFKYRKGEKKEVWPGFWIEKKSFTNLILELEEQGKQIYLLDKRGTDIRELEKQSKLDNAVFILGDQDGLPKRELKLLRKLKSGKVSIGPFMLFASQALTILQNELDRRKAKE